MPWHMERRGDKVVIVKDSDGKVVGTHSDRRKAIAQLRALYASESIRKASFSSRSEAGRYAANIRWMGHISEKVKLAFKVVKPDPDDYWGLENALLEETDQLGVYGDDSVARAWKETVMKQIVASLDVMSPNHPKYRKMLEQLEDFSPLESYGDTSLEQLVSGLINSWAVTSNDANPLSLAIQDIAKETFGLTESDEWTLDPHVREATDIQRILNKKNTILNDPETKTFIQDVLKAQYQLTQKYFAEKGITEVEVYRGFESPSGTALIEDVIVDTIDMDYEERPDIDPAEKRAIRDKVVDVVMQGLYRAKATTRPLSAWSTNQQIAYDFSGRMGVVMRSRIPVKEIFSTPQTGFGCHIEKEVVVLGTGARNVEYFFPSYRGIDSSPNISDFDFTNWKDIRELALKIYYDLKGTR